MEDFFPMGRLGAEIGGLTYGRGLWAEAAKIEPENRKTITDARKEAAGMPGPRQKLSVLEGRGKKHLSKSEKAQRAAQEVALPKPARMRVPKWLPEYLKADFRALAKELLDADMGAAQLDRDTLGRYLVAQRQFTAAMCMVQDALDQQDAELAGKWTKAQDAYFKQARACANDLGMTITSRCRLVLPDSGKRQEENPFERMMRERERRA